MKQVPRDVLEEIRARNDMVDVIGAHLNLIRAGSRFKALCPFHHEKTPSFHVNPQMQAYHCFGCGAGGDVFRFIMEHESVDFMTAVRILAHRVGIPVVLDDGEAEGNVRGEKDALYRLHEELTGFYHERLQSDPDAEPARAYLASRELDGVIADRYRFGFAPMRSAVLSEWARKRKRPAALLVKGGIYAEGSSAGGDSYYDRFRGRLMIPIRDELGRVIGFTARVLRAEDSPAKYVNSPETPLFRKSRVLFGLDRARKPIADARCAVLCEGQLDTIRCQTAGIENTIAAQGTAVTEEHARLLVRYADEVILVLDPDEAGRRAALRSAQLLIAAGLGVRVVLLPEGEDPDSLIRGFGVEAMRQAIASAVSAMAFLVGEQSRAGELASDAGLLRASSAAMELASHAAGAVQREQLLREAADLLGVREQALRDDFRKASRRRSYPSREATDGAPPEEKVPPEETGLLEACLSSERAREEVRHFVPSDTLSSLRCRTVLTAVLTGGAEALRREAAETADAGLARFIGRLLVSSRLDAVSSLEVPPERIARELIVRLWRRRLEEQREAVRARLRDASDTARAPLEAQRAELSMRLASLGQSWPKARAIIEAELDAVESDD